MRPFLAAVVIALATLASIAADGPAARPPAVEAVSTGLDVEKALLKEDLDAWSTLTRRRADARLALDAAHEDLDAALRSDGGPSPERVATLMANVETATRDLGEVVAAERELADLIRERRRKIVLLEEKLSGLQARSGEAAGPMTGTWDVSLLPTGQRGRFFLSQSGALVTGTYVLDGGFTGSLQGTFVNRKLVLDRIDAKLGRWGKFEGSTSPDGVRIRGTWLRMELAGGEGGEGQWTAVRAASQP